MKTADLVTLVPMNQIWQALKVCQPPSSNCLHKDYASSQNLCFEVSIQLKIYCAESIRSIYAYIKASILWRLWPRPHFCECNCNDSNCCAVSVFCSCLLPHSLQRQAPLGRNSTRSSARQCFWMLSIPFGVSEKTPGSLLHLFWLITDISNWANHLNVYTTWKMATASLMSICLNVPDKGYSQSRLKVGSLMNNLHTCITCLYLKTVHLFSSIHLANIYLHCVKKLVPCAWKHTAW